MRAHWRDHLDTVCPTPSLGWLTFYRLLRELSLPGSAQRKGLKHLRAALSAMQVDPNGPTVPMHLMRFFETIGDDYRMRLCQSIYYGVRIHLRDEAVARQYLAPHRTPTRQFPCELSVPFTDPFTEQETM